MSGRRKPTVCPPGYVIEKVTKVVCTDKNDKNVKERARRRVDALWWEALSVLMKNEREYHGKARAQLLKDVLNRMYNLEKENEALKKQITDDLSATPNQFDGYQLAGYDKIIEWYLKVSEKGQSRAASDPQFWHESLIDFFNYDVASSEPREVNTKVEIDHDQRKVIEKTIIQEHKEANLKYMDSFPPWRPGEAIPKPMIEELFASRASPVTFGALDFEIYSNSSTPTTRDTSKSRRGRGRARSSRASKRSLSAAQQEDLCYQAFYGNAMKHAKTSGMLTLPPITASAHPSLTPIKISPYSLGDGSLKDGHHRTYAIQTHSMPYTMTRAYSGGQSGLPPAITIATQPYHAPHSAPSQTWTFARGFTPLRSSSVQSSAPQSSHCWQPIQSPTAETSSFMDLISRAAVETALPATPMPTGGSALTAPPTTGSTASTHTPEDRSKMRGHVFGSPSGDAMTGDTMASRTTCGTDASGSACTDSSSCERESEERKRDVMKVEDGTTGARAAMPAVHPQYLPLFGISQTSPPPVKRFTEFDGGEDIIGEMAGDTGFDTMFPAANRRNGMGTSFPGF